MKLAFTLYFLACIIFPRTIIAQTNIEQNRHIIEDAVENSAEQLNESGQFEIPDELMDLLKNPLDINTDNLEIFVRFNLMSSTQLSALVDYRKRMGNFVEEEELQQVEEFNKKTILSILPYITVHSIKKEPASHQFTLRYQKSISRADEYYPGSNAKILFRYRATVLSSYTFSFTGEKDAGEEIFTRNTPGFDFNSFNISYKGNKLVRKIILGDYNLEFGQGLAAWTGFSFGNGSSVTGIYKFGRGVIPFSGTDENRFLRGVAVSLQKNNFKSDVWISSHKIDGNKVIDTLTKEEFITSLQTSGYHRTYSENLDHHSQKETYTGTSLIYSKGNITTGITLTAQFFSIPVKKNEKSYAAYRFNGKNDLNAGWNYSFSWKNLLFFGENVVNINKSFAFVNGLLMSIDPRVSVGFLWRSYAKNFPALKSNAFGVNSENNNETGNYFGINYKINRMLNYSGYVDIYSFPFLIYRVDSPSNGFDQFHQLEFTPSKKFTSNLRYRKRLKQLNDINESEVINQLSDFKYENIRLSSRCKIDNTWEYSFRVEILTENKNDNKISSGTMVSQDLFFHPMRKPFSVNCRYAIFNCPQFNSRIYEYENDVQGAFSIPFYYGSGSRFYTNLNYKISKSFTISLRYSTTWLDEEFVTTNSSEIKVQLKASFR